MSNTANNNNPTERNMTYKSTITAITNNFNARQNYINSEPKEIRDTIRWTEFVRAVHDVVGDCGSDMVHAYAREMGV